ncbi:hypothetical protein Cni_G26396 [Canna indica]|uniref:Uncharacterized protein n=1 Tax=Canna indica TaxID=4628 RepID=A0AAQ3L2V7_9LILI|nr:hypothetical protein Cni_G26396 [Canna indica]
MYIMIIPSIVYEYVKPCQSTCTSTIVSAANFASRVANIHSNKHQMLKDIWRRAICTMHLSKNFPLGEIFKMLNVMLTEACISINWLGLGGYFPGTSKMHPKSNISSPDE